MDAVKRAVRRNPEGPDQLSARFFEDALSTLLKLHHRRRYLKQLKPHRCDLRSLTGSDEEFSLIRSLKLFDMLGDRRLTYVKSLRGGGEAP